MYKTFFKRAIDIVLSLIATPFVLLAIAVMAPFIYLEDRGPVFYNATRRGKNGKNFKMFKLRSMYLNAPDIKNADGSTFNSDNDPRVTKIGKFMRKTSVDELPQIFNVLIGDMSFIGPRPTLAVKPYEELPEINKKRLTVRPGITGYAQAYYRNSITQEEKFQYDCFYAENVTFLMDVQILFKTVISVLKRENINTVAEETKEEVKSK
jgi:lipopolysaccharide/colanic/teichoic acid biosynthesis glycosyltransferase